MPSAPVPFKIRGSIAAAGIAAALLCAAIPAGAAASPAELIVDARTRLTEADHAQAAPPALLAQTVVLATPAVAMRPVPARAVAAPGSVIRAIAPSGSQPGVLWLIAMGVVCCRIGTRVLGVS